MPYRIEGGTYHRRDWTVEELEMIARGRCAIKRNKWVLGDWALEMFPKGRSSYNDEASVYEIAREVGIGEKYLESVLRVSANWPFDVRFDGVSWTAHKMLVGRADKVEFLSRLVEEAGDKNVTVDMVRNALDRTAKEERIAALELELEILRKDVS